MPNEGSCAYDGMDTTATVGSTDGGWFSRCNCTATTCTSGTYEEATAALDAHRNP